ncbi:MAG TPA: cytochrome b/b6 domain-containing protein [Methyloceanibacter sp.]|nr:cytochrome b/b6 domain-containing protein [Methyloceanibacter sp.]
MLNPDRNGVPREVYVWDPFVRLFHWTLVIAFTIAYLLTDEEVLKIHVWSGYVVGALVVARVIWGFVGPEHARFTDFVYAPGASLRYVRDLILFKAERHLGHSPGGGAMVVTLLVFLAATVITGLVVYGGDQQAGPLAGMFTKEFGESFEGVHELIANITLALVLAHISAVILASFVFRENLPRAMFTGYKRPL